MFFLCSLLKLSFFFIIFLFFFFFSCLCYDISIRRVWDSSAIVAQTNQKCTRGLYRTIRGQSESGQAWTTSDPNVLLSDSREQGNSKAAETWPRWNWCFLELNSPGLLMWKRKMKILSCWGPGSRCIIYFVCKCSFKEKKKKKNFVQLERHHNLP